MDLSSKAVEWAADKLPHLGRGTYALILYLPDRRVIQVGRLGESAFDAGYYAYVGSAQGPGGLRARLIHHLRGGSHPHWHIDYLRRLAGVEEIWLVEADRSCEHEWAVLFQNMPGAAIPAPRFGASDCACPSHLVQFREMPSANNLVPKPHIICLRQHGSTSLNTPS